MKSARVQVRVHGAIFCISVLFGLSLITFKIIDREQLLFAAVLFFVFGEVVLGVTRYCGPALDEKNNFGGKRG